MGVCPVLNSIKNNYNRKYVSSLDVNVQNTFTEIWTTRLINLCSEMKINYQLCIDFIKF